MFFFRRVALFCALLFISFNAYCQISGVKNIPGDYPSIQAAANAINMWGVGGSGVTFNVSAGHVETSLVTITATGSAQSPIVFRKSGTGSNPKIIATSPASFTNGIIKIQGGDYIAFQNIDLSENPNNILTTNFVGFGFYVTSSPISSANISKHISISGGKILLAKGNSQNAGIYMDRSANCSIDGVSIDNVITGIRLAGTSSTTAKNNKIGVISGNVISDFSTAISCEYQDSLYVFNNHIDSDTIRPHLTFGVDLKFKVGFVEIANNYFSLKTSNGTSGISGIVSNFNDSLADLSIHGNVFENFYSPYKLTLINALTNVFRINLYGNEAKNINSPSTSYFFNINHANHLDVYGNKVHGIVTSKLFFVNSAPFISNLDFKIRDNLVYDCTFSSITTLIKISKGTNVKIVGNKIHNLTSFSITVIDLDQGSYSLEKNEISGIYCNGSQNDLVGLNINTSTATLSNNIIGGFYQTAAYPGDIILLMLDALVSLKNNTLFLDGNNSATSRLLHYIPYNQPVELINNIFYNTSVSNNGTGYDMALFFLNYFVLTPTTNNNIYYVGTPSYYRKVCAQSSVSSIDYASLAQFQAHASPAESNSKTENVPFLSTVHGSSGYLRINPNALTKVESGGVPIANLYDDIDSTNIRIGYPKPNQLNGGGTAPDIGADEGDFIKFTTGVDIKPIKLISPDTLSCDFSSDSIIVRIRNIGVQYSFGQNDSLVVRTSGAHSALRAIPLSGIIPTGANLDFYLDTMITTGVGIYDFEVFVKSSADINHLNDTLRASINRIQPLINSPSTSYCLGDSFSLFITGTGSQYIWQEMNSFGVWNSVDTTFLITSHFFNPADTGIYKYRALQCGIISSDTIEIKVNPTPVVSANSSSNLICSGSPVVLSGSGTVSYSWNNGVTDGLAFYPQSSQTYTVIGTDANGCTDTASVSVIVDNCISINENDFSKLVKIFPNPSGGSFQIVCDMSGIVRVDIYSIDGRLLTTESRVSDHDFSFSQFASGVYIVAVTNENGNTSNFRLIVQ